MKDKFYHTLDAVGGAANMLVAVHKFFQGYYWMKQSAALARNCDIDNSVANVTELDPTPTPTQEVSN